MRRDAVRLGGAEHRRQGRGADDAGDHPAPARADRRRRPRGPARPLPGRPRSARGRSGRARSAGAGRAQGLAGAFSAGRERPRSAPSTTAASSPRSSRRRRWTSARHPGARAGPARARGRRDRPRLPAGHALPAPRGGGAGAEGGRATASASIPATPPSCGGARRAGAEFLLSLTEDTLDLAFETDAMPVLIPARHGGLDGLVARLRAAATGRPTVPRRPDPRPDPFRLHRVDRPLPRAAPRLPEAEMLMGVGNLTELTDADTTGITMTLMGMVSELRDPQHPGRAGEPALPAGGQARPSWRAASSTPPSADGSLPQGYDAGLLCAARPAAVPQQPGRDRWERRASGRPQLPHRGRRGRHPRLQPRRPSRRRGPVRPVPQARRRGRTGRTPSTSASSWRGRRSPTSSASATSQDNELRWGVAVEPPAADKAHFAQRRPARSRRGAGRRSGPDAVHPREHRHHAERGRRAPTSPRSA